MVWSGNGDRVHILQLENRAKVFLRGRSLAHLTLRGIGEFFQDIAVHIADMRNARGALFAFSDDRCAYPRPFSPITAKLKPVVGAHDSRITLRRISDRQPRRAHCQCIQKLTPSNHLFFPSRGVIEALTQPPNSHRFVLLASNPSIRGQSSRRPYQQFFAADA